MGNFQNDPSASDRPVDGQKKQIGLFLKNGSKVLPPRRSQLPVSNSDIQVDDNEDAESGIQEQNQYQLAMNEAIKRHEQNVKKIQELRKIQEDDFRQQVDMEGDIIKLENEQVAYKKTKLNEDLKEQMRQNEIKNQFDTEQNKIPVSTNGGPVVPERSIVIQKFKNKQALTKLDLERQM